MSSNESTETDLIKELEEYARLIGKEIKPEDIKDLIRSMEIVKRLFREEESNRLRFCIAVVLGEPHEHLLNRYIIWLKSRNLLRLVYGSKPIEYSPEAFDREIKRCKETYNVYFVNGRYKLIPKNSVMDKILREVEGVEGLRVRRIRQIHEEERVENKDNQ
ncbi:MAG: hypothetical protein C0179_03500 [Fervidicoccus sp.]|nr:MAG: hypothetical protein C0179_03500 [Fervidicoccus sp.]